MIDNKNLIYYQNETPIISQPLQGNINKITQGNENLIDYEVKNEDNCEANNGRWERVNILDFWADAFNMEIIGKKLKHMLEQGPVLRLDHMHKNI